MCAIQVLKCTLFRFSVIFPFSRYSCNYTGINITVWHDFPPTIANSYFRAYYRLLNANSLSKCSYRNYRKTE